jgi:hypothetical protein
MIIPINQQCRSPEAISLTSFILSSFQKFVPARLDASTTSGREKKERGECRHKRKIRENLFFYFHQIFFVTHHSKSQKIGERESELSNTTPVGLEKKMFS